jgi:hypothetical protein
VFHCSISLLTIFWSRRHNWLFRIFFWCCSLMGVLLVWVWPYCCRFSLSFLLKTEQLLLINRWGKAFASVSKKNNLKVVNKDSMHSFNFDHQTKMQINLSTIKLKLLDYLNYALDIGRICVLCFSLQMQHICAALACGNDKPPGNP